LAAVRRALLHRLRAPGRAAIYDRGHARNDRPTAAAEISIVTSNSQRTPPQVPQLTVEGERALLVLYDFAVACRTCDLEDHGVAEQLGDAAAVLGRRGIAAGAPEM
jgi:hypothetical protein